MALEMMNVVVMSLKLDIYFS